MNSLKLLGWFCPKQHYRDGNYSCLLLHNKFAQKFKISFSGGLSQVLHVVAATAIAVRPSHSLKAQVEDLLPGCLTYMTVA